MYENCGGEANSLSINKICWGGVEMSRGMLPDKQSLLYIKLYIYLL